MLHQLTHQLLFELKEQGYTVLIGSNQASQENYVYTPENWDVEEFLETTLFYNYDNHAIDLIEELLKIEEEYLLQHSVLLP